MGTFLAAAAVRDRSLDEVAEAICAYAEAHRTGCESLEVIHPEPVEEPPPPRWPLLQRLFAAFKEEEKPPARPVQGQYDAVVFEPENGWTVILWPPFFSGKDVQAARWLSRKLGTVVSAVHVTNGDFWTHFLFDAGKEVDRFASIPDYFAESPQAGATMQRKYAGDPKAVAERVGVAPEVVARYYVHLPREGGARREKIAGDEFALDDAWVFTDFWRALGIRYPADVQSFERQLAFAHDFDDKLPGAAADEL